MPLVPLESLPDGARTWVFGASRALTAEEAARLLAPVDAYLAHWKAHGAPLTVARAFTHDRFLTIAVDQRTAGATGCSIDGLFRELQGMERTLDASLVAGGRVFWRDAQGTVQSGSRDDFEAAAASGAVQAATPVFDPTVMHLGDWRARFERPAGEGWHAHLLPVPR
jgi:hypothetical protein